MYDSEANDASEIENAKDVMRGAMERMAEKWHWYTIDVAAPSSSGLALESNLRGSISVFVRTPEDGIDEMTLPLTVGNLVRFLRLRGIAGNPLDVEEVHSGLQLRDLVLGDGMRPARGVLVRYIEPWCSHCVRMRRQYESGATLLKDQVVFASVDCSVAKELCESEGVEEYPTIRLYVPQATVANRQKVKESPSLAGVMYSGFEGSRVVASYEYFLFENQENLPPLPVDDSAALQSYKLDGTLDAISVYPLRQERDIVAELQAKFKPDTSARDRVLQDALNNNIDTTTPSKSCTHLQATIDSLTQENQRLQDRVTKLEHLVRKLAPNKKKSK